ncbi:hypothetical protein [Streptomyces niveus]|uniref:hypothetical protein n=1 Tax=Streptomyces niveus TaxID=193462 RepID=UPI003F4E1B7D
MRHLAWRAPDAIRPKGGADARREAAESDTRTPHWFGATDAGPVEFLSLTGKQGERAHVRAAPKPAAS